MGLVDLGKHALIILDDHEAYNGVSELEPLSTDRTCPAAVSMRRLTPRAGVVRFNRRLRLDNARCGRAADDGITVLRPMVLVDYPSRCSALVCFVRGYSFAITLFGHCIIAILQPKEVVTLDSTRFSLIFAGPPDGLGDYVVVCKGVRVQNWQWCGALSGGSHQPASGLGGGPTCERCTACLTIVAFITCRALAPRISSRLFSRSWVLQCDSQCTPSRAQRGWKATPERQLKPEASRYAPLHVRAHDSNVWSLGQPDFACASSTQSE